MSTDRATPGRSPVGVRIAGVGSALPEQRLTNADLEKLVDTTDEWIRQRTGIAERRKCDPAKGESAISLSSLALKRALEDARIPASELDLVIIGTVTGEMVCPSTACRVAANIGAGHAGAFDLLAACCGFVYSLNIAHELIRGGSYKTIGVVGCDALSYIMDYKNRNVCIIFGDAAGAAVLRATDDTSKGILAQAMHADGSGWKELYLPRHERDLPPGVTTNDVNIGTLQMNGREVFKFAVGTFPELIAETLKRANLQPGDIDHFICHQSNARILEAARERFGIPHEKMYVNIDRVGNTSAGSVPLCLDELRRAGRVKDGQKVMFVAFGGGLTWSSSLWQL